MSSRSLVTPGASRALQAAQNSALVATVAAARSVFVVFIEAGMTIQRATAPPGN
jgi:hypothetical protein